jgi:hypothetical protein
MNRDLIALAMLGSASILTASALDVRVTVENLSPNQGTFLTPLWVGFHNGTFDLFDAGSPASAALERLAEDGVTSHLAADLLASNPGSVEGTLMSSSGPFAPGASGALVFSLDPLSAANRFMSYASMVIPSNDAFIANGNPLSIPIFAADGTFLGADFIVLGGMVWDAGTEVNDEEPANTAFLGQTVPNTGVPEGGVVNIHSGFQSAGSGGILDVPDFSNADFKATGYQIARITVTAVPDGSSVWGLAGIAALCLSLSRRRWRSCQGQAA